MNLEQAIHERWAADAALAALVPAARVTTGRSLRTARPYVTILPERAQTSVRSNAGETIEEITLRMNVWHDDYGAARAVVERIRAVFNGVGFALSGARRVLHMRRLSESALQHADGVWQLSVRFVALVLRS